VLLGGDLYGYGVGESLGLVNGRQFLVQVTAHHPQHGHIHYIWIRAPESPSHRGIDFKINKALLYDQLNRLGAINEN